MNMRWAIFGVVTMAGLICLLGTHVSAVAQDGSAIRITGRVVEDIDGDRQIGAGDRGGETLIDLERIGDEELLTSVNTDSSGNFAFNFAGPPSGSYRVWIWWTPGFIDSAQDVPGALTVEQPHAGVRIIALTDVQISSGLVQNLAFLVNPKAEGQGTFPVRTGQGPVAVGEATFGSAGLPDAGTGPGSASPAWIATVAVAVFAAVGVVAVALGARRRKDTT